MATFIFVAEMLAIMTGAIMTGPFGPAFDFEVFIFFYFFDSNKPLYNNLEVNRIQNNHCDGLFSLQE